MKLKVMVDWDDLTEDTQFNLNYRFKQEIIEQVIDRIYEKLTADWQNEITVAIREKMEKAVLDQVGFALENWIGERVDHIINQNIDKIINQLLKNKLSVALSRIVE